MASCSRCSDKFCPFEESIECAARNNHINCLKLLLTKCCRLYSDKTIKQYVGPGLMRASAFGNLECLTLLLEQGADVNYKDEYGRTALFQACRYGFPSAAAELIAAGAEVNCVSHRGMTSLTFAASQGNLDCIQLLAKHGANVNLIGTTEAKHHYKSGPNGVLIKKTLPVHFALREPSCLKQMIRMGADVDLPTGDASRITTVMIAASGSRLPYCNRVPDHEDMIEVLKVLLARKPDLTQLDCRGQSAFSHAVLARESQNLRILVNAAMKSMGRLLCDGSGPTELGLMLSHQNRWGKNVLMLAAQVNHLGIVQTVLEGGVRVNCRSFERQQNALEIHMSCGCTHGKVISLLLACGEKPPNSPVTATEYGSGFSGSGFRSRSVSLPSSFTELASGFSLVCKCREAIRSHMLQSHGGKNLFFTIPKLENYLPDPLVSYLLYNVSLTEKPSYSHGRCHSHCLEDDDDLPIPSGAVPYDPADDNITDTYGYSDQFSDHSDLETDAQITPELEEDIVSLLAKSE